MRWSVFVIFAYLFLALEVGLDRLLHYGPVAPSFLLILGVFIGLSAPPMTAIWSMLILGLLTDLSRGYTTSDQQAFWLIGPAALAYLCGGLAMLQLRGLVFRHSVIAMAVMVFVVGVFTYLVTVAMLTLRSLPWPLGDPIADWSATDRLVRAFSELVYCAFLAVPLGLVLARTEAMWGFIGGKGRTHQRLHRQR